jgi:aryl-alcohol dehydrogenase-like predicted oxidoreductase
VNYRTFGRTAWKVSDIALGLWGMGEWSGSKDDESLGALQLAVDLECNFFDSAWRRMGTARVTAYSVK